MLLSTTMAHENPDHKPANPHTPAPVRCLPSVSPQQSNHQNLPTNPLFNTPNAPYHPRLPSPVNNHLNRTAPPYLHSPRLSTPTHSKWRVTPAQKQALLDAFQEEPYPELAQKNALAARLGVTTTQISKWFQHRRESLTRIGQFKAQYNRTRRTPEELDVLQSAFELDRYPSADRLAELESQLSNVTAKQIKLWFKHRRKQVQKRNRTAAITGTENSPSSSPLLSPNTNSNNDAMLQARAADRTPAQPLPDWTPVSPALPGMPQQSVPTANIVAPPSVSTPVQYSIPQNYYYKGSQVLPNQPQQFSELEAMALRGALAIASDGAPTTDALTRLAALLNRPFPMIAEWFRAQVNTKPTDPATEVNYMSGTFVTQPEARPSSSSFQPHPQPTFNTSSAGAGSHIQSEGGGSQTSPLAGMPGTGFESSGKSIGSEEAAKAMVDGARVSAEKSEAFGSSDIMQSVQTSVYPGYVYTAGVITQPPVGFPQQPQNGSAPMLAPLRHVPSSNVPQYANPNAMWYGQAPGSSKG